MNRSVVDHPMNDDRKDSRLLERRFRAQANELCRTRDAVRSCLTNCGCQKDMVEDVVLAIDEACQNIIRHAYCGDAEGEIVLELGKRDDTLVVSLLDFAPEASPDCMKPRDLDDLRPGGLGTHFIRSVMDDVSLGRAPSGRGNLLRMIKRMK